MNTRPETEQEYIERMRKATPTEKFAIISSLSTAYFQSTRETLRQSNPKANKQELDILFVEQLYGKELAERLQHHMNERQQK